MTALISSWLILLNGLPTLRANQLFTSGLYSRPSGVFWILAMMRAVRRSTSLRLSLPLLARETDCGAGGGLNERDDEFS